MRAFGSAQLYGDRRGAARSRRSSPRPAPPTGRGYWLVAANGAVFAFGDARFYGGMSGAPLNAPIVGMAATPSGHGYILLGADGGIFTFGDAQLPRLDRRYAPRTRRVLDLAITASGNGYWFVAADGGVFSFGDAQFHGSTGAMQLAAPVMSIASASDGRGYWLVASDGGIFAFDVPFEGSLPEHPQSDRRFVRADGAHARDRVERRLLPARSRRFDLVVRHRTVLRIGCRPRAPIDLMLRPADAPCRAPLARPRHAAPAQHAGRGEGGERGAAREQAVAYGRGPEHGRHAADERDLEDRPLQQRVCVESSRSR